MAYEQRSGFAMAKSIRDKAASGLIVA